MRQRCLQKKKKKKKKKKKERKRKRNELTRNNLQCSLSSYFTSPIHRSARTKFLYGLLGSCSSSSEDGILFITRHGLPTATEKGGMSFVTTDPAPIVQPSPIVIPGRMMTIPPIQQSFPMKTGWPNSTNFLRDKILVSCPAVYMLTFGPNWTLSPTTIRLVSKAVKLITIVRQAKREI